jgi:subtilisin family serine protease
VITLRQLVLTISFVALAMVPAGGQLQPARRRGDPPAVPGEYLVRFRPGVLPRDPRAGLAALGVEALERFEIVDNLWLLRTVNERALAALQARADVVYAEPNYLLEATTIPNDPSFGSLWGLNNGNDADIDAPEAWDISTGSSSIVIGVIDTGIDYNHADLNANMFRNETDCNTNSIDDDGNGYVDDCYGLDTRNGDSDPMDDNNHGTHVAGTIGAVGNNGIGVVGVNWNVKLMACKFLSAGGSGSTSAAIGCLNYFAVMKDSGVNLVATNNSWGGTGFSQSLSDAIETHRQRGILFIAAAGNSASDNDGLPHYPSNYYLPNIISVASTTSTDQMSGFSDFGRWTVHLGAPGSGILSTTPGNNYQTFSGTSMATPHVTGAAALLKAQDPSRDWRAIKNLLISSGDAIGSLTGATISSRRLNVHKAMTCSDSAVYGRVQPVGRTAHADPGQSLILAALNINCANPNGALSALVLPGAQTVALLDNGSGFDQVAGDGIYTGSFVPSGSDIKVIFPGEDVVTVNPTTYTSQTTTYSYRSFAGTNLNLLDESSKPLTSPFPIRIGRHASRNLYVSDNGVISLVNSYVEWLNASIPQSGANAFVAPYWDDFNPAGSQNVYWIVNGSAPDRELVVEWRDVPHYDACSPGTVRFEVVFFENSRDILFNYMDVVFGAPCASYDRGGSATVGVQVAGSRGTQYSFNSQSLNDETALLWTTSAPPAFVDSVLTGLMPKTLHMIELRARVNTVRTAFGLGAFTWTDPNLVAGATTIKASHLTDARTALQQAYEAGGRTAPSYTDPTVTAGVTPVRAIHLTEIRSGVLSVE